uniref:5-cytosine rRNA methyltransferase NSUN4 n=1 Tax=Salarias fasciatus TaxID=181472 RepID=A0A672J2W1_SALFA
MASGRSDFKRKSSSQYLLQCRNATILFVGVPQCSDECADYNVSTKVFWGCRIVYLMIKHPPTRLALQHFDATYSGQLGKIWPSVRVALLSERKYGALLNHFSNHNVLEDLQSQGCSDFISYRDEEGRCFCPQHPVFRVSTRRHLCGLLSHYLMDAASVLPCLALDVQEGHNVLDLCAAPGGKTLALLQTQSISFLCVNDASVSRTMRLRKVLNSYVPKEFLTNEKLRITSFDGTQWGDIERNTFDRVLVDVPCTTDRHSLMEDDNNIFSKNRIGERRRLPQLQAELLLAGIQAACPGGEILYSTCTLSQSQNQSVVEQAVFVVSLRPLTQMFQNTFYFAPDLRLGEMVLPHLTSNFGPIYMCKLRRLT